MRPLHDLVSRLTFAVLVVAFYITLVPDLHGKIQVFPLAAPDSATITVAVLDFKNNSGLFNLDVLEKSVPEMLKTELSQTSNGIAVVERQKLDVILQEHALGQTGVIDEKTAQTLGQLAGAQYLLTGEISATGSSRLRIDCHILKVETAQVRGEKVIGRDREVIEDMVRLLAANILFNLKGEGQYRQSLRVKSYPTSWFLLATAVTAVATGVTHVISQDAYQQYQSATSLEEFDKYFDRAHDFRNARNALAIATGALAIASANFWLKERSEQNQVFASVAPPERPWQMQEMTFFADQGGVRLGVCLHF